jgi:hypothetical protein
MGSFGLGATRRAGGPLFAPLASGLMRKAAH